MQTRKRSLIESILGTIFGIAYAIPLNYLMVTQIAWTNYWYYAVVNTFAFTVASVLMKYGTRRLFNLWDR